MYSRPRRTSSATVATTSSSSPCDSDVMGSFLTVGHPSAQAQDQEVCSGEIDMFYLNPFHIKTE